MQWLTENPCFLIIQPHYQRNHRRFYGATGTFLLLTSTARNHELHFGEYSGESVPPEVSKDPVIFCRKRTANRVALFFYYRKYSRSDSGLPNGFGLNGQPPIYRQRLYNHLNVLVRYTLLKESH